MFLTDAGFYTDLTLKQQVLVMPHFVSWRLGRGYLFLTKMAKMGKAKILFYDSVK